MDKDWICVVFGQSKTFAVMIERKKELLSAATLQVVLKSSKLYKLYYVVSFSGST